MNPANLPFFRMLSRRMDWLNQRQRVLAANIANADTPHYRPRDLKPMDFGRLARLEMVRLEPARTDPAHLSLRGGRRAYRAVEQTKTYETSLSGNAVVLEEQLLKVSKTGMDYALATRLYRKHLGLFRIAIGRGGSA